GSSPQYRYLRPGIAMNAFDHDPRRGRILQLLDALFRAGLPDRVKLATEFLESADLFSSILLLERLARVPRGELTPLIDVVARRRPEAAFHVRSAIDEVRRQALIVQRRAKLRDARHRFLLALVLNVDSRDEILRLVADALPGRDPVEQIVEWVGEISA